MDDRPLRAFLSHTAELREHPAADPFVQAAERAVTRAGHAVVDMAYFTARDDKPAKYCRQKVSECDVYVGLIGFRYGSPVRDERDKSYVELEYETAGQAELTRLLFLLSEHPTVPLPIEAVTDSNFGDRQTRFRQDIRDTTKANFDSPAQLETLLYQALVERAGADARGPVRPAPFMAPRQDDSLIDRPEITRPALTALTAEPSGNAVGLTTALRGAGGFGKTTLATQLCHHPDVRNRFPGGILWKTVGEQAGDADVATMVNELCWQLTGARPPLSDPLQAGAELGVALGERRLLLVVDDVWTRRQLDPFLQGGPNTVRLITTRQASLLPEGTEPLLVDAMKRSEAEQLVGTGLSELPRPTVDALLRSTGRWPMLLKLVSGAIRDEVRLGRPAADAAVDIAEQLRVNGPTVLDVADQGQRHAAVSSTLEVSIRRLGDDVDRYLKLAIFPEDTNIPGHLVERLRAAATGWAAFQTRRFLVRLADLSLLLTYDLNRIRIHDVSRGYLRAHAPDQLARINGQLVNACRSAIEDGSDERTDGWWRLPDTERYLWQNIPYHLAQANNVEELRRTLHDLRFIARKTRMLGPASIEADLALGNDPTSCTVGAVLRQASHLLGPIAPDAALDATLLTRIKQERPLRTLAETFEPTLPRPYLAALGQLPGMPEPALRRVLTGHTDMVWALAVDPAGRWLASAGDDATVRIWDPDTGSPRHVLTGHGDWVRTLAADPAGRWLASVGDDRAVRIYRVSAPEETCALRVDSRLYLCAFLPDAGVLVAAGERGPYFLEIVT